MAVISFMIEAPEAGLLNKRSTSALDATKFIEERDTYENVFSVDQSL